MDEYQMKEWVEYLKFTEWSRVEDAKKFAAQGKTQKAMFALGAASATEFIRTQFEKKIK